MYGVSTGHVQRSVTAIVNSGMEKLTFFVGIFAVFCLDFEF